MLNSFILLLFLNPNNSKINDHLKDLKWKNRVLVVVTNDKEEINDITKIHNIELTEREFVIIQFDGENSFIDDKLMSKRFSYSLKKKVKDLHGEVHLILIGKDGEIKNFYTKSISLKETFSEVDKMPMRMNEMRRKINRY